MKEIIVFGGTFDPPHLGHTALAEAVRQARPAAAVLFIPAYQPPHKQDRAVTPYMHRLAMLKLALARHPGLRISEIERERNLAPSYSLRTLRALRETMPDARISMLVGSDSLLELHHWHAAETLVREFDFVVFPRRGAEADAKRLRQFWPPDIAQKLADGVLNAPFYEISSTEVRKKLANSEKSVTLLLDRDVLDYIRRNKLYERISL